MSNTPNKKNILVTGSCGFIASHLIEKLLKDPINNIVGIDNFYSGTKENLDYINKCDINKKFNFIKLDIRNYDLLTQVIKENNIQYIYHLAAIVSVQESIQNPLLSNQVNIQGTLNILEASRHNNVKKIVFSSSAAVYGDEPSLPKNELSPLKPISPYGLEKFIGEEYMLLYSSMYKIQVVILRYFNVYGERQSYSSDYSGVISVFESKLSKNEAPTIYGDGEQYRDFIYVKDIAKINILAMNSNTKSSNIFCVGTSNKTSINNVYTALQKKYNVSINANYETVRPGDIAKSICDNTKLKNTLKYNDFTQFNI